MKTIGITCTAVLSALLGVAAPAYGGQERQGDKQEQSKPQQQQHEQARPQQHAQQPRQEQQSRPQQQHAQQTTRQEQNWPQQQHAQQARQEQNRTQQQSAQQARPEQNRPQQQHARQVWQNQNRPQQQHAQQQEQRQQTGRVQQQRSPQDQRNGQFQRTPEQQGAQRTVWQQHRSGNWESDHRTWQQRGGYDGYRIPDDRFRGDFGSGHGFRIRGLPFMEEGGYPRFQYRGYWFRLLDPWPGYWGDGWYDDDDVYVDYVGNGYYLFNRRHPGMGIAISISM